MTYTYNEVAMAMGIVERKIDSILEPVLAQFDIETKRIANMLDKVCYEFHNLEEKAKLIKMFEDVKSIKDNSKYSKYIKLEYEIDGRFFFVDWHIARGKFANEQRVKATQNITIEL